MSGAVALFISGLVFAIGLGISGMTDANKVIGFLNLAGSWDPSLAFVMVGAIGVHYPLYRWVTKRPSPLYESNFYIPSRKDIDARLVAGGALFGFGWGLGGFCPGPAVVSAVGLGKDAVTFTLAMLAGMVLFELVGKIRVPGGSAPEAV